LSFGCRAIFTKSQHKAENEEQLFVYWKQLHHLVHFDRGEITTADRAAANMVLAKAGSQLLVEQNTKLLPAFANTSTLCATYILTYSLN
jgi:hypothetical protein